MSKIIRSLFLALLSLLSLSPLQAQFIPGNLALLRTNDATNNSTCTIIEINTSSAGQSPITFTGTARDLSTAGWSKGYYGLQVIMEDGSVVTGKIVVQ